VLSTKGYQIKLQLILFAIHYYYIYQCKQNLKKKKHTKILLVDEPDILEIVGYNLNQEGYQIFTANGKKRLLKLKGIA
jgi:hypothetical protein